MKNALDFRLERESRWSRKSSTTCEANRIIQDNLNKQNIIILVKESETYRAIQNAKKAVPESIKKNL